MRFIIKFFVLITALVGLYYIFQISRLSVFPVVDRAIYAVTRSRDPINYSGIKAQDKCLLVGGVWSKPGLFPNEICRKRMKDAGAACYSGFQCESGNCIARMPNLREKPVFAKGQCPEYIKYFGCLQTVHFGVTSHGVCLD